MTAFAFPRPRRIAAVTAIFAATISAAARAEPDERPPLPDHLAPVAVTVGGQAAMLFGDTCRREASDVIGCSSNGGYAGGHLATAFRLAPLWSVGVRGSASAGTRATWWQANAFARWHVAGAAYPDLWLGVDAGLVAIAEHVEAGELGPATTRTKTAPAVGLEAGIDFPLARILTLGPSLRGLVVPFSGIDYAVDRGSSYATQIGVELGLGATLLLGD